MVRTLKKMSYLSLDYTPDIVDLYCQGVRGGGGGGEVLKKLSNKLVSVSRNGGARIVINANL